MYTVNKCTLTEKKECLLKENRLGESNSKILAGVLGFNNEVIPSVKALIL